MQLAPGVDRTQTISAYYTYLQITFQLQKVLNHRMAGSKKHFSEGSKVAKRTSSNSLTNRSWILEETIENKNQSNQFTLPEKD